MTFFNKKTEVMQIEMTPYGRYLYSIGKFKPHSYEFVDDDILYRASGSTEAQESSHSRILNETPKLKINRAFQCDSTNDSGRAALDEQRKLVKKINQRQADLSSLGRSSYSSNNIPSMQVTMLRGQISGSRKAFETNATYDGGKATDISGSVSIPQVDIDLVIDATLKSEFDSPKPFDGHSSRTFDDGTYVSLSFKDPIIHLKEFNSFYEKENFTIEVFESHLSGEISRLNITKYFETIVDDILVDSSVGSFEDSGDMSFSNNEYVSHKNMSHYFDIEVDSEIPPEELCKVVDSLEINNQFLDEELICPDQRTDRFDIYNTRVGPEDLEDCD